MMKQSAGILLYRDRGQGPEVLLVHPGGPFWRHKDVGAWSIPKGEFQEGEDPLSAAKREFMEELGSPLPDGEAKELGSVQQSGSKLVFAWAVEADFDPSHITSNNFELEWPPKSGNLKQFPEVDKADWFTLDVAQAKMVKGQVPLLSLLTEKLNTPLPPAVALPATAAKRASTPPPSKPDGNTPGASGQTVLF